MGTHVKINRLQSFHPKAMIEEYLTSSKLTLPYIYFTRICNTGIDPDTCHTHSITHYEPQNAAAPEATK